MCISSRLPKMFSSVSEKSHFLMTCISGEVFHFFLTSMSNYSLLFFLFSTLLFINICYSSVVF